MQHEERPRGLVSSDCRLTVWLPYKCFQSTIILHLYAVFICRQTTLPHGTSKRVDETQIHRLQLYTCTKVQLYRYVLSSALWTTQVTCIEKVRRQGTTTPQCFYKLLRTCTIKPRTHVERYILSEHVLRFTNANGNELFHMTCVASSNLHTRECHNVEQNCYVDSVENKQNWFQATALRKKYTVHRT